MFGMHTLSSFVPLVSFSVLQQSRQIAALQQLLRLKKKLLQQFRQQLLVLLPQWQMVAVIFQRQAFRALYRKWGREGETPPPAEREWGRSWLSWSVTSSNLSPSSFSAVLTLAAPSAAFFSLSFLLPNIDLEKFETFSAAPGEGKELFI